MEKTFSVFVTIETSHVMIREPKRLLEGFVAKSTIFQVARLPLVDVDSYSASVPSKTVVAYQQPHVKCLSSKDQ